MHIIYYLWPCLALLYSTLSQAAAFNQREGFKNGSDTLILLGGFGTYLWFCTKQYILIYGANYITLKRDNSTEYIL